MADRRDPVEAAAGATRDLYDVAMWEPRTWLDRLAVRLYAGLVKTARAVVVLVALAILFAQIAISGLAAATNPAIGAFILLSVLPAAAIALYVWRVDVTMREPLGLLVTTFLLGVLFAGFAAALNSVTQPMFEAIPVVGFILFFYIIVGPVEETVKWLAIRLHAYRSPDFNAVIDGAVYGAMAGLGFATIENAIYISEQYVTAVQSGTITSPLFSAALPTAAVRTFAGPGHVIYSAFAGYYLGLAKFNREHAGPIIMKGLLIASFIHATYNTLVGVVPGLVHLLYPRVPVAVAFVGFVIVYDGVFGYALYRKIANYRAAYRGSNAGARLRQSQAHLEPTDSDEAPDEGK